MNADTHPLSDSIMSAGDIREVTAVNCAVAGDPEHPPSPDSPFAQWGLSPALRTAQAVGRAEMTGKEVLYKL